MPKKKTNQEKITYYQIKITLVDSPLPIWRKLLIHADMPLDLTHEMFQIALGWSNYHLHQFEKDGKNYADLDTADGDNSILDDTKYTLRDLLKQPDDSFLYLYDFGDNWQHKVVLENIEIHEAANFLARCIDGKRACPPEDVGGVSGYDHFIESIEDEDHEEHIENLEWAGCNFDPNSFDARIVNLRIELFEQSLQMMTKELAAKTN